MASPRSTDAILIALVFADDDASALPGFVPAEELDAPIEATFLVEPEIPDSFLDLLIDVQCGRYSLDVDLIIGPQGIVENAELPVGTGLVEMDACVHAAALETRFAPLRWRGQPVRSSHTITYSFEFLSGGGTPPAGAGRSLAH